MRYRLRALLILLAVLHQPQHVGATAQFRQAGADRRRLHRQPQASASCREMMANGSLPPRSLGETPLRVGGACSCVS